MANNIIPLIDMYRAFGADFLMDDTSRNHYVSARKVSFKIAVVVAAPITTPPASPAPISIPKAVPIAQSKIAHETGPHPALSCNSLDELRHAIETSTGCDLIKSATNTVFSSGDPKAAIMFIGEAPGVDEDLEGKPFVGQSGQLLDAVLASIGIERSTIYIANIIPWRPPGNRPPTTSELTYCLPFIERHIQLINPKIIVLLGGVATKALLRRNDGILKLRGQFIGYESGIGAAGHSTILALPTYHPAYIMRSPSQKALVWKDMLQLKRLLNK